MKSKIDIMDILNAASKGRQLNALLQNLFEKGTDYCQADDELVGLAYDISGKIAKFLDLLEQEENK
jgi:hypothetical protein